MKSFKDIVSEVALPNNPEELKHWNQHSVEVMDHPVAEPEQFSGEIQGKRRVKRLSDYVAGEDEKAYDQAYKESVELEEKAVSVAQQKLMAMALAYKRGEMDDASDEVKKIADSMSEKDLEDFAKTKHKGLPDKVDEAVEGLLENPMEEIPMMKRQLAFIIYAAEEISDYLDQVDDPEEWYQNKLAYAFGQMKTLHAYAEGSMRMGTGYNDSDDYDYYASSYGYGDK